ncbi:MAG: sporulation initiation factor Spo0A C-terminal domain-containing protein [Clostridiales bacterium]|jgi:hypothetical protein|nr:sporulation initiation factor Spo0A C-terminal domain-containing protein [Clostridiales bacterium]
MTWRNRMSRAKTRKAIKEVARTNRVSVTEVKREMQLAIDSAYKKSTSEASVIPRKNKTPTPQEFIEYMCNKITKNTD